MHTWKFLRIDVSRIIASASEKRYEEIFHQRKLCQRVRPRQHGLHFQLAGLARGSGKRAQRVAGEAELVAHQRPAALRALRQHRLAEVAVGVEEPQQAVGLYTGKFSRQVRDQIEREVKALLDEVARAKTT